MPDYTQQRINMVESQVRTNDVTDVRIQNAMRAIPRELFVPEEKRPLTYADTVLQLENGRFLLDPRTFSKLAELAQIAPGDRVLDVGCATGYSTAVLGQLAPNVIGLEISGELAREASRALSLLNIPIHVVSGSLNEGHAAGAPYDVIFINGAVRTAGM